MVWLWLLEWYAAGYLCFWFVGRHFYSVILELRRRDRSPRNPTAIEYLIVIGLWPLTCGLFAWAALSYEKHGCFPWERVEK